MHAIKLKVLLSQWNFKYVGQRSGAVPAGTAVWGVWGGVIYFPGLGY
jgi:hypothetical protein